MDVLLEASGFTKKMALDLNKAYDDGNFLAHCEQELRTEKQEDEEGEKEEDSDSSDSESEGMEAIQEDEEEKDHEEVQAQVKSVKQQKIVLSQSTRFNDWLSDATTLLDNVDLKELKTEEGYDDSDLPDKIVSSLELYFLYNRFPESSSRSNSQKRIRIF